MIQTILGGMLGSFIVLCVWILGIEAGQAFNEAQELYKEESHCIALYIAEGVERKDIIVTEGTCYVSGALHSTTR